MIEFFFSYREIEQIYNYVQAVAYRKKIKKILYNTLKWIYKYINILRLFVFSYQYSYVVVCDGGPIFVLKFFCLTGCVENFDKSKKKNYSISMFVFVDYSQLSSCGTTHRKCFYFFWFSTLSRMRLFNSTIPMHCFL